MTATKKSTLRITGPAELITAVPYLLGFHPQDSLVLVGLAESRLVVTARLDLDDAHRHVLTGTVTAMARGGTTDVVAAIYGETAPTGAGVGLPHQPVIDLVAEVADSAGMRVAECLGVGAGRWWSYSCQSPACCPAEGRLLAETTSVVEVDAVFAGLTAAPTREALTELFARGGDAPDLSAAIARHQHSERTAALSESGHTWTRAAVRALFAAHRDAHAGRLPGDEDIARLGVALRAPAVRDAAWLAVDDRRLSGAELWLTLARQLPRPYDAAPLFLTGWGAYRDGNGALAGIAADKALLSDPGYSAAELLLAALANGVDPRSLPRLRLPARAARPEPRHTQNW